jgi:hypothetical protein
MAEVNPADVLRKIVAKYPTQRAAAKSLGISEVYLCDLLRGRRPFSTRVLKTLGLRAIVVAA